MVDMLLFISFMIGKDILYPTSVFNFPIDFLTSEDKYENILLIRKMIKKIRRLSRALNFSLYVKFEKVIGHKDLINIV